jgi:hypothetical protein
MTVTTPQRAIVVAVRLSDAGRKELKWLYRGLEEGAELDLHQQLDRHYDAVEVISGDVCTPDALVELGRRLAAGGASPKLRLLYSTACYGQSHAAPLVAAGFSAVVGSKGKNTNGLSEFRKLLTQWTEGKTITEAVHRADRPIPRMFWDVIARLNGFRQVDSEKVITGDGALTISTDP